MRALLQDPEFLYRIEIGTPTATAGVFALDSLRDRDPPVVPALGQHARRRAPD